MQRLKLLGLALIAVFALGAAVASVASAESAGIKLLPDTGEAAGSTFSVKGKAGERPLFETAAGNKVECEKLAGNGTAVTDPLGTVTLEFQGCEEPATKFKCTGLADTTTGNITFPAEYHFRYLLPETNKGVQLLILIEHVHFSCTALALILVSGCVGSMDLENASGSMLQDELVKSFLVLFLQSPKGKQEITSVDNEADTAMETCELLSMKNAGGNEKAGELAHATLEKFTKEGKEIEVLLMH
jgi:hypothetical protein